jgi:hypothetical protein
MLRRGREKEGRRLNSVPREGPGGAMARNGSGERRNTKVRPTLLTDRDTRAPFLHSLCSTRAHVCCERYEAIILPSSTFPKQGVGREGPSRSALEETYVLCTSLRSMQGMPVPSPRVALTNHRSVSKCNCLSGTAGVRHGPANKSLPETNHGRRHVLPL